MDSGVYRKDEVDLTGITRKIMEEKKDSDIGALVTFTGVTRRSGKDFKEVEAIEMESYKEVASKEIIKICREVEKKHDVFSVNIFHLIGKFKVGEPLVFVAVVAKNRKNAIIALEEAINRYKTEPPLWKKEIYSDGTSEWISHS